MHKKHQMGDNSKVLKRGLSFLYATHRHDLFYITVKYESSNILNGIQVIERTRKCLRTDRLRTDARLIDISPKPFGWGIIMEQTMSHELPMDFDPICVKLMLH